MSHKLLWWGAVLISAATWEVACGYKAYDLRRSTSSCIALRSSIGAEDCLPTPPSWCIHPAAVSVASPWWLAAVAGYGGPLITWLPLLTSRRSAAQSALKSTILWYLALIGPVRHSRSLLPAGWDPSGHVFVYGAQLVPYWQTVPRSSVPLDTRLVECFLALWCSLLWYLSAATAAFFHTASETLTGWLLVAGLHFLLIRQQRTPAAEARTVQFSGAPFASWLGALLIWVTSSGAAWGLKLASGGSLATLQGELAYDTVLWSVLWWLIMNSDAGDGDLTAPGGQPRLLPRKASKSVAASRDSYAEDAAPLGLHQRSRDPSSQTLSEESPTD